MRREETIRICWASSLLMFLFVVSSPAQETRLSPELALLARVRQRMAENLDRLPNYTCQETIERLVRRQPDKEPIMSDKVRLEVALIGLKEMFAWPGSPGFEFSSAGEMVAVGAARFGDFGSLAHTLFRTWAPAFTYGGEHAITAGVLKLIQKLKKRA